VRGRTSSAGRARPGCASPPLGWKVIAAHVSTMNEARSGHDDSVPDSRPRPDVDPVRFEVSRNALLAITEEMGATPLRRAAYSTTSKTRGDFSCAFFDRDLRTIAQASPSPRTWARRHIVPKAIATTGPSGWPRRRHPHQRTPYLGGVT